MPLRRAAHSTRRLTLSLGLGLASLTFAAPASWPAHAVAQQAPPALGAEIERATSTLARYDLADPRTYEALDALRRVTDANGPQATTARTLRAYAAVDLLVAATLLDDGAALARLGATLGTSERTAMSTLLDAELSHAPAGAMRLAAREGRATLAALEGRAAAHGVRSDAVLLASAPPDAGGLRELVQARFEPAIDSTLEIVPEHAEQVRRLVSAMLSVAAATQAADAGDPLLVLLRPRLEAVRARLAEIVIADPRSEDIDAFLTVSREGVSWGYLPRTRVDVRGRPVLESGRPAWPLTASVSLPTELATGPRTVEALRSSPLVTGSPRARVALRVEADVPVQSVARVVRSLEGTPLTVTHVATPSGRVAATFLEGDAVPASAVRVVVRPAGYAIERRGGRVDIARVRTEGHWRFDRDALVHAARGAGTRVLSASAPAPAAELFESAVLLAQDGRVALTLP